MTGLNLEPLLLEATAPPTEPQPLPNDGSLLKTTYWNLNLFTIATLESHTRGLFHTMFLLFSYSYLAVVLWNGPQGQIA